VSIGDGFDHQWGRNGEFCVAVGLVVRTAGILAYCVPVPREMGLTFTGSKVTGCILTDLMIYAKIFFF